MFLLPATISLLGSALVPRADDALEIRAQPPTGNQRYLATRAPDSGPQWLIGVVVAVSEKGMEAAI